MAPCLPRLACVDDVMLLHRFQFFPDALQEALKETLLKEFLSDKYSASSADFDAACDAVVKTSPEVLGIQNLLCRAARPPSPIRLPRQRGDGPRPTPASTTPASLLAGPATFPARCLESVPCIQAAAKAWSRVLFSRVQSVLGSRPDSLSWERAAGGKKAGIGTGGGGGNPSAGSSEPLITDADLYECITSITATSGPSPHVMAAIGDTGRLKLGVLKFGGSICSYR
jgi:hypothetical protein